MSGFWVFSTRLYVQVSSPFWRRPSEHVLYTGLATELGDRSRIHLSLDLPIEEPGAAVEAVPASVGAAQPAAAVAVPAAAVAVRAEVVEMSAEAVAVPVAVPAVAMAVPSEAMDMAAAAVETLIIYEEPAVPAAQEGAPAGTAAAILTAAVEVPAAQESPESAAGLVAPDNGDVSEPAATLECAAEATEPSSSAARPSAQPHPLPPPPTAAAAAVPGYAAPCPSDVPRAGAVPSGAECSAASSSNPAARGLELSAIQPLKASAELQKFQEGAVCALFPESQLFPQYRLGQKLAAVVVMPDGRELLVTFRRCGAKSSFVWAHGWGAVCAAAALQPGETFGAFLRTTFDIIVTDSCVQCFQLEKLQVSFGKFIINIFLNVLALDVHSFVRSHNNCANHSHE